jgi:hypothetical protein
LKEIWESLGTPVSERESVLESIASASKTAQHSAVKEANTFMQASKSEEDVLTTGFEDMCGVLDIEEGAYFDEETLKTLPLLERIDLLKNAFEKAENELSDRTKKLFKLKSKLVYLMVDMNLKSDDVCSNLQRLLRVDDNMATASAQALASHMLAKGVMISPSHITQWDSNVRDISVEQVNNINQSNSLKKDVLSISDELGFASAEQFSSIEFGIPDSLKEVVVHLLLNTGGVKTSGDAKLLQSLEKCLFVLQTIKSNRKNCVAHLEKLSKGFNNYLKITLDDSEAMPNEVSVDYLETKFHNVLSNLPVNLETHVMNVQIKLAGMVTDNRLSASEYDQKLGDLATSAVTSKEEIAMLADLDEPMSDLTGLMKFIEEGWLNDVISSLNNMWHENRSQVIFAIVLGAELNRFNIFIDALKDVKRYDIQLSKHVVEMEDFEIASKQDRQKMLTGNSRGLMEEEKFRKNGKRKFEQITERLVQAARSAQTHSDGMHMDISHLSQQGQDLLRGKIQERIELMHLHTTTHGTKRWSGDKISLMAENDSTNDENVLNNQDTHQRGPRSLTVSTHHKSSSSPPAAAHKVHSRSRSPQPRGRNTSPKRPNTTGNDNKLSSPKEKSSSRNRTGGKKEPVLVEGFPREAALSSNPFDSLLNKN